MTALLRRYPCLYTNEAKKKPQNQRKLDGYVTLHHHNLSAVLWNEECRAQLKWTFLRGHPDRKRHDNGSGGVKSGFLLKEDEEVTFGDSHIAWITGAPVEESLQDLQSAAVLKQRKRASVAAWLDEDQDGTTRSTAQGSTSKRSRVSLPPNKPTNNQLGRDFQEQKVPTSANEHSAQSSPSTSTSGFSNPQEHLRQSHQYSRRTKPLWRKSENAQIGVSPNVQVEGEAAQVEQPTKPADSTLSKGPPKSANVNSPVEPFLHLHRRPSISQASTSAAPSALSSPSIQHSTSRSIAARSPSLKGVSPKLLKPFRPPRRKDPEPNS